MPFDGQYSRTGFAQMFDESKRYLGLRMQKGVSVVDADLNDVSDSVIAQLRRVIQLTLGDASPTGNNGFKIAQAGSPANNFTIKGGDGTDEGAGRFFASGLPASLKSDLDYVSNSPILHPRVTARVALVLTDDSANYVVNELAGRTLCPNIANPGTTFTIASNTATTITITAGDLTAACVVGDHYRVNLSTPGGARSDAVYLDAFLDEESTNEDSNLLHALQVNPLPAATTPTAAAFRVVLRQLVKVRENAASPTGLFTDALGRKHFYIQIAALARTATANVNTGMITDSRASVKGLIAIETDAQTGIANAATAQSTANTAVTNAATAQGTANTALANAATAQAAADAAQADVDALEITVAGIVASTVVPFGGDKSLGNLTIAADQTLSGVKNYDNLTINAGVTVTVPTLRALHIKCRGNLTLNGVINARNFTGPGGIGGDGDPTSYDGSPPTATQSLLAHTAGGGGGAGGTGVGTGHDTPGSGAAGGTRSPTRFDGVGGAGGVGTGTSAPAITALASYYGFLLDMDPDGAGYEHVAPGAPGGGGGHGGGTVALQGGGGQGGAGAGVVIIEVLGNVSIGATGGISANGSDGARGGPQGNDIAPGGGGGGGGGGAILIKYAGTLTIAGGGFLNVAGGAGGLAGDTLASPGPATAAGAGRAGENGYSRTYKVSP